MHFRGEETGHSY